MLKLATVLGDRANDGQFWTHSKMLVEGCTKISEGCGNCWSEAMARRFGGMVDECGNFDGTLKLHSERMADILPRSNRRQPRIWTYWNDLFHHNVGDWFRDNLFEVISQSSDTHIICTKRPHDAAAYLFEPHRRVILDNVIFLVTMESQKRADERLPWAACISAAGWKVGALVEPMLTLVDLTGEWGACLYGNGPIRKRWIDALCWIVNGPENGKGARKYDGMWSLRLMQQAKAAGVPFFYKAGLLNGKRYIETP